MLILIGAVIGIACTVLGMLAHAAMLRHAYGPEWAQILDVYKAAADKARAEREEQKNEKTGTD